MNSEPEISTQTRIISLSGLHEPWREVLHLGTHLVLHRSQYTHPATTDYFYFIASGRVRLTFVGYNGEEHVVLFFGAGCIFNETSVLTKEEASEASFRVLEKTDVYRFPGYLLHDPDFISRYPHLLYCMLVGSAMKFARFNLATFETKQGTSMEKVCRFLRHLSRCHNNATCFPLDMTKKELASVLNIHRVSLFRCLQQLQQKGILLRFSRREIVLKSLEGLEAFLREGIRP